jgi:hypothetical protein
MCAYVSNGGLYVRYKNIFKMFGNPEPRECESKQAYAEHLLEFFGRSGRYCVTRPSRETIYGPTREFNWQRRVWQAALEQYERSNDAPYHLVLPIDRKILLQFLMEAVEEVKA